MRQRVAQKHFWALLLFLGLVPLSFPPNPSSAQTPSLENSANGTGRVVFLGGKLSDEDLILLTSDVAASGQHGVVLLDSAKSTPYLKGFLTAFQPERVIPLGLFPEGIPELEQRLGVKTAPVLSWERAPPIGLWKYLFPQAERVVVCPAQPRTLLLQAACLAGVLEAPLFILRGRADEMLELSRRILDWRTREVFLVGSAGKLCNDLKGVQLTELRSKEALMKAYLKQQRTKGPIDTLVLCNPADAEKGLGNLSALSPYLALQRRAALLFTNTAGTDTAEVVHSASNNRELSEIDSLILLANLKAIPMERRPNPVPGKDAFIEMEPLTPSGPEPFSFAIGRLFHEDLSVVALVLARQQLLAELPASTRLLSQPKALVVSNPGGGLSLLETFSRNTAKELHNGGYQTTGLFNNEVAREEVRRLMPSQDIFLWEGHYRTLVDSYGLPQWNEPLQPSLIFLQSCLALNEAEAQPLLRRGAVALVGSSTRTYSGSGGAFTLAFFDAMLYENQSLGASLRQAKNFLSAYALLKEKRLGVKAKLAGANLRSAWAFTLWGDPTLKLPRPKPPADALAAVHYAVRGNTIVVTLPETAYPKVMTDGYQAEMWPNARLAGLLNRDFEDDERRLVPFLFAEVRLPNPRSGKIPRLSSRVASKRWVFSWDARRQCGTLVIVPGTREEKELRFQVHWDGQEDRETRRQGDKEQRQLDR